MRKQTKSQIRKSGQEQQRNGQSTEQLFRQSFLQGRRPASARSGSNVVPEGTGWSKHNGEENYGKN
jgi:hypothetical protein